MDVFLDKFFIIFHTLFALFNLFGWMWKKTRKINLVSLILTFFSWVILGIWYGLGYCPLTEWHWHIRYRLGFYDMPDSYVKFLLDILTGMDWNEEVVEIGTAIAFSVAFLISIWLNIYEWRNKDKSL